MDWLFFPENGVRRSDALELAKECGFDLDVEKNPVVDDFIKRGRGQTRSAQGTSGVTLQEFAEFLERLVLGTEWNPEQTNDGEAINMSTASDEFDNTPNRWEARVLQVLRKHNEAAEPNTILPEQNFKIAQHGRATFPPGQPEILHVENQDDLVEILKQEIEITEKTLGKLKGRKRLAEAQIERKKDLESTLQNLRKQLRKAKSSLKLKAKGGKLNRVDG